MIILKVEKVKELTAISNDLNSNMIILKANYERFMELDYKKFKFQYDNT